MVLVRFQSVLMVYVLRYDVTPLRTWPHYDRRRNVKIIKKFSRFFICIQKWRGKTEFGSINYRTRVEVMIERSDLRLMDLRNTPTPDAILEGRRSRPSQRTDGTVLETRKDSIELTIFIWSETDNHALGSEKRDSHLNLGVINNAHSNHESLSGGIKPSPRTKKKSVEKMEKWLFDGSSTPKSRTSGSRN